MIEDLVFKGKSVQEALRKASNFFGVAEEDLVYDFVDEAPEQEVWIKLTKNPIMPRRQPLDPVRARDQRAERAPQQSRPMGQGYDRPRNGTERNQGMNQGPGMNRQPQGNYNNPQGPGADRGPQQRPYRGGSAGGPQGQQGRFNRRRPQGEGYQQRGNGQMRDDRDRRPRDNGRQRFNGPNRDYDNRPPRRDNWTPSTVNLEGFTEIEREAYAFVDDMLKKMGMRVEILPVHDQERVIFNVDGPDRPDLLQRKGETLIAIQYLVNKIFMSRSEDALPIYIDSMGYRMAREEELREIALAAADKVKRSMAEYSLSPMNPYERRQIHIALKEDPDVATVSRGDGYIKRVSILPASMAAAERSGNEEDHED